MNDESKTKECNKLKCDGCLKLFDFYKVSEFNDNMFCDICFEKAFNLAESRGEFNEIQN